METSQRVARSQTDEMPPTQESAYEPPTGKDKISARIGSLTKKKLIAITEIWKAQTRVEKEAEAVAMKLTGKDRESFVEAAVADVDLTYTIDKLLKRAADVELAQWGGYPDTAEKLAATVKLIEKSAK
jgi:hypothetical protein